jgi:hypothetical protein
VTITKIVTVTRAGGKWSSCRRMGDLLVGDGSCAVWGWTTGAAFRRDDGAVVDWGRMAGPLKECFE